MTDREKAAIYDSYRRGLSQALEAFQEIQKSAVEDLKFLLTA